MHWVMRSRFLLTAAVPALLLLAAAPAHAAPDPEGQRTFATAGCGGAGGVHANEFTVPLGVTELTIEARGAAGKGSGSADGGDGLELTHELSVTKGDKFYFCVDEGAGAAGVGPGATAGGGYTLVSRNADLSNPMMIAGGGGGASSNSPNAAGGGPAGFPLGIAGSGWIGSTLTYGTGATSSVPGVGGTSVMPISNGETAPAATAEAAERACTRRAAAPAAGTSAAAAAPVPSTRSAPAAEAAAEAASAASPRARTPGPPRRPRR